MNKITYKWKKNGESGRRYTDGHYFSALYVYPYNDTKNDRILWIAQAEYERPGNRHDQPSWDIAFERKFITKQDAKQWLIARDLEGFASSLRLDAEYADAERTNPFD